MRTRNRLGEPHLHFDSVDTTMRVAAERAEEGAPEGLLVTADRQTAGRGRLGRSWMSDPALGLYLSLVLRPPVAPANSLPLTLAAGLGVAVDAEKLAQGEVWVTFVNFRAGIAQQIPVA